MLIKVHTGELATFLYARHLKAQTFSSLHSFYLFFLIHVERKGTTCRFFIELPKPILGLIRYFCISNTLKEANKQTIQILLEISQYLYIF